MIDVAESVIERQRRALERTASHELLYAVAPFLRALREQPSIRAHLDDLERDALDQVRAYNGGVEHLIRPIMRAWETVTSVAETVGDDNYLQRATAIDGLVRIPRRVVFSLTRSDGFHSDPVERAYFAVKETEAELRGARVSDERLRPVVGALIEIGSRIEEAVGVLNVQARRPAFSLLRLMTAASYVPETQREPRPLFAEPTEEEPEGLAAELEIRPLLTGIDLTALAASRRPDIDFSNASIQRLLAGLADDFAELHDDLSLALGTVRSRLALIDRFVARCERYDRQTLADLADGAPGKPESVLRDQLARYLFDAGLDPLTEASLATTRADVLDVSSSPVLVEAKQYKTGGKDALSGLIKEAYLQTVDTAAELRPRVITEAFVVVFRRSGGRLILPEDPIRLGATDYLFRLVDLAPSAETGSGAKKQVIELTVEDITSVADTAGGDP